MYIVCEHINIFTTEDTQLLNTSFYVIYVRTATHLTNTTTPAMTTTNRRMTTTGIMTAG